MLGEGAGWETGLVPGSLAWRRQERSGQINQTETIRVALADASAARDGEGAEAGYAKKLAPLLSGNHRKNK